MAVSPAPPPPSRAHWTDRGLLRWTRRYLGYSRAEARGLVLLLLITLGFLLAPLLLRPCCCARSLSPIYPPPTSKDLIN